MSSDAVTTDSHDDPITFSSINHISLPVRDRAEATRFWTHIMGAKVIVSLDHANFTLLKMPGGVDFGLSERPGGWTGRAAEYPHYGLNVDPDKLDKLKDKLDRFGVPTHNVWTRFRTEGLMYFRDPSGNLFELYCHEGYPKAGTAPVADGYGGDFRPDLEALNYDTWNDPGA